MSKINKEMMFVFVIFETRGVKQNGMEHGLINLIVGLKRLNKRVHFFMKMMESFGWLLKMS